MCFLEHVWLVLVFWQEVQHQAAVAPLVGLCHPEQRDAERLGLGFVRYRVAVLPMQGTVTPLVYVLRKEPGVMHSVIWMIQRARLFAHQCDVSTFRAHVGDVWRQNPERIGVVFTVTWRWENK